MRGMIRIFRKSSIFLFPAGLSFVSVVLLIVSSIIGVADVRYAGRQVGYASAPNWFLSPVLLFPIAGALAILIVRWVDRSIAEMANRKMLFDTTKNIMAKRDPITRRWNYVLGLALGAWIVLSLGAFAVSIQEWHDVSYFPLTNYKTIEDLEKAEEKIKQEQEKQKERREGKKPESQKEEDTSYRLERDWSIAALFTGNVDRKTNYLFSLGSFLVQGWMLSCLALFLVVCVAFGTFIFRLSGPERITIVPDLRSSDKRRGFEIFEDVGGLILLASLCLFFAFYLTLLQNLYLNGSAATSLIQMLVEPIVKGIHDKDLSSWAELLTPKSPSDYSTNFAQIGGIIVIILVVVLIPGLLLFYSARCARDTLKRLADLAACRKILGRDGEEIRRIAETMKTWPYRYFTLNTLIAAAVVLATVLFWPLIAAYFYGVVLATVVPWTLRKLQKNIGGSDEKDSAPESPVNEDEAETSDEPQTARRRPDDH